MSILLERAREHERLVAKLDDLNYSPAELTDNEAILFSVNLRLHELSEQVCALEKKTKLEQKEISKLKHNTGKKFMVSLHHMGKKGAVDNLLAQEESQFMEDMQSEYQAEGKIADLQREKLQLETAIEDLRVKEKTYNGLRARLDILYRVVFDGASTEWPWEEQAQRDLKRAESEHSVAQSHLNREAHCQALLAEADECLQKCVGDLKMARGWDYNDMRGQVPAFVSEAMESRNLVDAQALAGRAERLVQQARAVQPLVLPITKIDIAQLSFVRNVLFDTPYAAAMVLERIQASVETVSPAAERVSSELSIATERVQDAESAERAAAANVDSRARRLEGIRREIMRSVSQGVQPVPPPAEPAPPTRAEMLRAKYGKPRKNKDKREEVEVEAPPPPYEEVGESGSGLEGKASGAGSTALEEKASGGSYERYAGESGVSSSAGAAETARRYGSKNPFANPAAWSSGGDHRFGG